MRRARPPVAIGQPLGDLGRARRFELEGDGELWRFGVDDRSVVERLLGLGRQGVGGFGDGGEDDDGLWLARSTGPSLSDWLRSERSWRDAVGVVVQVARALAAAEAESLFPGPLSPRAVVVIGDEPMVLLPAEPLVRALVGAGGASGAGDSASARWIAPEQAAGAPWDNAANRYVLGLLLYRALAGAHPFAERGLRLGLEEQAQRAPPPFPEPIAAMLPPGLMSYCLRLLAPDSARRPPRALEIVERLRAFVEAPQPPREPLDRLRDRDLPSDRAVESEPPRRRRGNGAAGVERESHSGGWMDRVRSAAWAALPVIAGVGLLGVLLLAIGSAPQREQRVLVREPLTARRTLAADCATCHPRQSAEWHRSVMAHSAKSPLFQALEMLIEEQVGRDQDCPQGAGILRGLDPRVACRDRQSGLPVTGSGGELWCVNCHAPAENLRPELPAWDALAVRSETRQPLRDLLSESAMEGISCAFCHQVHGPVSPSARYQGNAFWTSTRSGRRFAMRPEDRAGLFGISNSGYELQADELLAGLGATAELVAGGAHARPSAGAKGYLRTSEFCGSCHDVRLFGSDVIGVRGGEHFKRLRNAYSEWVDWAARERRAGRNPATCQDCHMSAYPGRCEPAASPSPGREREVGGCPPGFVLSPRAPGRFPKGLWATGSSQELESRPHYFSGVDLPLTAELPTEMLDEPTLDAFGIPLGAAQRRDMLLAAAVRLDLEPGSVRGGQLELPLVVENVGAGHRVPAGFSQERELWIHLTVRDARGDVVYEVGRVDRDDQDLADKVFLRVNTDGRFVDGQGRPLGLFGADVADGRDVPRWSPNPARGGTLFRGRGLINFQNGFLRCVVCIGTVDARGRCQPLPGQDRARADRFADGAYDPDTGECRSNLSGDEALLETYFPIGGLDASRGVVKGPDAIIDTRSLPPGVPIRYVYEIDVSRTAGPYRVEARLLFRAFPPFLLRAFAEYELARARGGHRPSGPLVDASAARRNPVVEVVRKEARVQ